jgi:hypothetical protein
MNHLQWGPWLGTRRELAETYITPELANETVKEIGHTQGLNPISRQILIEAILGLTHLTGLTDMLTEQMKAIKAKDNS